MVGDADRKEQEVRLSDDKRGVFTRGSGGFRLICNRRRFGGDRVSVRITCSEI